jgi:guanosine-3',5'-bis(diphosphate) 3'-pyrophosphohydrolase
MTAAGLEDAIKFAVDAHTGAFRKGTDIPYILHPLETAAIAAGMTNDCTVIAAAVLHDTVEDTAVTIEDIRRCFGNEVAALVSSESENKRANLPSADTWKTRKQETLDRLLISDNINVKIIALSDKLSNIRAIYRDYLRLGDRLWGRFNQPDPQMHEWYYRGVADALSDLRDFPAWQEYSGLLDNVWGGKTMSREEQE